MPSKCTLDVPQGMRVRVETAGGGGFGDPRQRERDAVLRDLRDEKISAQAARELYGVTP